MEKHLKICLPCSWRNPPVPLGAENYDDSLKNTTFLGRISEIPLKADFLVAIGLEQKNSWDGLCEIATLKFNFGSQAMAAEVKRDSFWAEVMGGRNLNFSTNKKEEKNEQQKG